MRVELVQEIDAVHRGRDNSQRTRTGIAVITVLVRNGSGQRVLGKRSGKGGERSYTNKTTMATNEVFQNPADANGAHIGYVVGTKALVFRKGQ